MSNATAPVPPAAFPLGGYKWGVEYPTNGKRPDLEDDVLIKYKNNFHGDKWVATARVGQLVYQENGGTGVYPVTSFKIIDPRYTPVPPAPGSDWFDWDEHVAVKWPPEGTECEYWNDREWIKLIVQAVREDEAWLTAEVDWRHSISSDFSKLMPFGHHKIMRERRLVAEIKADAPGMTDEMAMLLIKAGWGR